VAAGLAAAAAVLVLVVGGASMYRDVADERDRARELAAALAAPDARTVQLERTPAADGDGGVLRVVWSPGADAAVVVGAGLPDPGDGRVYELWAIADDGPQPAGLFTPDDEGRVERVLELTVDEPGGGWGVTIEPEGGSPAPTGDILFQGVA
jgi:anti-sigma-K factor RskA